MKKSKVSFIQKAILFFNVIAGISLLLCYAATFIDPLKLWHLSFFGLAYPFILLVNILFIIIWIIYKKWYFLFSLSLIMVGYNAFNKTIGLRAPTIAAKDSTTIKLMTYNVHYLKKFGEKLDTATRSGIFRLIEEEQPDIIGFQEFFTRNKGKYDVKDSLIKILDTKHYYYSPYIDNDYESTGMAIYSKYPILKSGNIQLESENGGNRGIWVDVKKDTKVFRIYVVHLASISFQPEDYSFLNNVKDNLNKSKDVVSSKRIVRKLKNAFIKRSEQIKILQKEISTCTTPYIVIGDFNDTPVSYAITQITKDLKNGFAEKGSGLGITYNGDFPNFQIDYILASQQFDFKDYKIIKKDFSDHYPVCSTVTLAK
jgi:endonuclease/exonuclease/phosphatase family metal-dependent hydrolase